MTLLTTCAYSEDRDPQKLYPENYKVILEIEQVRMLDFKLRKGAKKNTHVQSAHVVYVLRKA